MSLTGKPIRYDDFRGALERAAYERAKQAQQTGFEHYQRDVEVLDRLVMLFDAGKAEVTQALRTASGRLNRGA